MTPHLDSASPPRREAPADRATALARDAGLLAGAPDPALGDREGDLPAVLQMALDGFWIIDDAGRFLAMNHAACEMLGYERGELLGMAVSDVDVDDAPADVEARIAATRRAGRVRFEARHRRKDGETLEVEVSVQPSSAAPGAVAVFVRDMTERKRSERAIAEQKDELAAVLATSLDAFWIIDHAGRLLDVNDAACAMLGYARSELLARRVADLEAAMSEARILEQIQRILRGGAARFDSKHRRRDGRVLSVEVSAQPLPGGRRVAVFSRDVTAHRDAEEQLRQAQKMEAVGRLAGGIAHDFNNLLTVMLVGCGFALDEAEVRGRLRVELDAVHTAAQKAQALTAQLLAFGRQQHLELRRIDLNALVLEVEVILARLLGEEITVRTDLAPRLGAVRADPMRIQQVILNLAINARDAMPGGGTITIRTKDVVGCGRCDRCAGGASPGGRCVQLSVEDTGVGMDEATKARVFEPFFTTKALGKGTGLGLSTVFGIVAQSGGAVRVESEPGRGARFHVCFPRHDAESAPPRGLTPPPPSSKAQPRADGETVLVVEDDPQVRRIAQRALQRAGFDVVAAGSYEDALVSLEAHARPPAVLLTDVRMPGRDGPSVSRELGGRFPGLRTVFMSGYSGETIAEIGDLPVDGLFVQKPFTVDGLVAKVREALDR